MATGPVAVLVNPTAGRGRHRDTVPAVLRALAGAGRPVEVVSADNGSAAPAACRAALDAGASALVAVGGDGTVHLALQAVAGTPVPFGIVPAGTGNDIATNLGLPTAPLDAAELIAYALRTDHTRKVDLGRVNLAGGEVRWFAGVFGAGFDAIDLEPTRVYRADDARDFLAGAGIDADAIGPAVDGKFISAFVRARKPPR